MRQFQHVSQSEWDFKGIEWSSGSRGSVPASSIKLTGCQPSPPEENNHEFDYTLQPMKAIWDSHILGFSSYGSKCLISS